MASKFSGKNVDTYLKKTKPIKKNQNKTHKETQQIKPPLKATQSLGAHLEKASPNIKIF